MRGTVWLIIVCLCNCFATLAECGEPIFPYTADVSVEEIEVRCGPDWDYYATQHLNRGTKVEVYRHDPGGWLAIRPPEGSFSWIPARQVRRGADRRVGEVAIDGAVAWVGSSVSDVKQHKWQVRLEQGELVEILGERPMSVGPGFATETYLQIAPPAGEFRWIHAKNAFAPGAVAHRSATRTIELTKYADGADSGSSVNRTPSAGGDLSAHTTFVQRENGSSHAQPSDDQQLAQLTRQIDQLKIDLSLLVTKQIDQWDLDALRARVDTLTKAAGQTPLTQELRLISYRIDEFETLRRRYKRLSEHPAATDDPQVQRHGVSPVPQVRRTSWQDDIDSALSGDRPVGTGVEPPADLPPGIEPPSELDPLGEPQTAFDAEGWLMPVHSTRRVAPPFALLDNDGRVLCYVQPSPGLNLRRHTKKYVGVFGDRQFVADLRASLITVTRVVKRK